MRRASASRPARRGSDASALAVVAAASASTVSPRKRGKLGADPRQLGRLVAHRRAGGARLGGAVAPLRRDVGRVGLHHDRRRAARPRPTRRILQRPLERHRAAEAEAKAELDEGVGLLLAAVEGMGEAARARGAGAAAASTGSTARRTCSSTGSPNSAASAELRREDRRLALAIEAGDEVVEADLADRDQARVAGVARERVAQRRQVVGAGRVGAHRMDAERVGEPMPVRQLAHPLEVGDGHRRDDDLGDAGGARPRDDVVAIGIELGGVEVAMRVDPHRRATGRPEGAGGPLGAANEESVGAPFAHDACAGAVTGHGRRATVLTKACGETGAQLARRPGAALAARMHPMKRVPLYSRSHRPTETPAEPAAAASRRPAPRRRRSPAAGRRSRATSGASGRSCSSASALAFWWSNPTFRAKAPLTIEQIDAAIRQSIEDKPLVSPESRAYDAIIPSVVRVVGLMTEGDDGSDEQGERHRSSAASAPAS